MKLSGSAVIANSCSVLASYVASTSADVVSLKSEIA